MSGMHRHVVIGDIQIPVHPFSLLFFSFLSFAYLGFLFFLLLPPFSFCLGDAPSDSRVLLFAEFSCLQSVVSHAVCISLISFVIKTKVGSANVFLFYL